MLAQLAGGVLNVPPDEHHRGRGRHRGHRDGLRRVREPPGGDGGQCRASRRAVEVREKATEAAAEMLEAAADDLELKDGAVQVKGVPQMRKTLAEIAHAIGGVPGFALPERRDAGARVVGRFSRRRR